MQRADHRARGRLQGRRSPPAPTPIGDELPEILLELLVVRGQALNFFGLRAVRRRECLDGLLALDEEGMRVACDFPTSVMSSAARLLVVAKSLTAWSTSITTHRSISVAASCSVVMA